MEPITDKKSLFSYLDVGQVHYRDIGSIIVTLRLILEEEKLKGKYKFLNHFCNWYVHNKLTKSSINFDIINLIVGLLTKHQNSSGNIAIKDFNEHIYNNLKKEFIELLKEVNYKNYSLFVDDKVFSVIYGYVISVIKKKVLVLPKIDNTDKKNELEKLNVHLEILFGKNCGFKQFSINKLEDGKVYWNLQSNCHINIMIPVIVSNGILNLGKKK